MRRCAACSVLLAACTGASPDPDAMAREPMAEVKLDTEGQRYLQRHVEDALTALAAGRYEIAEEDARLAIDLDPRAARARAVLGLCLLHRAQAHEPSDLALQNRGDGETLRAVRLQPRDPVVTWLRASFLGSAGHLSAAAEAAEQGLAALPPLDETAPLEPARVDLLAAAARYRYELGEERAARPHLAALLALRPNDAQAQFRYGMCLLVTAEDAGADTVRQLVAAAAAFARAAELQPDDSEAWLAVITAHARAAEHLRKTSDDEGRQTELAAAVAACDRAAERLPQDGEPRFRKGVALEAQGETAQAEQAFREALQRNDAHLGALLDLAALCAADPARRAEAESLLRRALAVGGTGKGRLQPKERERIQAFLDGGPAGGKGQ